MIASLILTDKVSILIAINNMERTKAKWNRDDVLRYARFGEDKYLDGRMRQAPASMRRLMKVILKKLFALNKTGTDFGYQPERVDADGFRPYFLDDLAKWTGTACRDTMTRALRWLDQSGIITLRDPLRDEVTGRFGFATMRFNPGVFSHLAYRVMGLYKQAKNAVKSRLSKKSPVRKLSEPSVVFNKESGSAVSVVVSISVSKEKKEDSRPEGTEIALFLKDQTLEEVLDILKTEYPDVDNLDYVQMNQVSKLVHSIYPQQQLTPEIARELVKCKRSDDEYGDTSLDGFNHFGKFTDLLQHWKTHVAKRLTRVRFTDFDVNVLSAIAYQVNLEESVFNSPEIPGFESPQSRLETFRQLVGAITKGSPAAFIKALANQARGYLLEDETAYAMIVKKVPAIQQWCGVNRYDHERLQREFKNQRTKINVWKAIRLYFGLEEQKPKPENVLHEAQI